MAKTTQAVPPMIDIPDFSLLRQIGSGSYGEVWLARGVTGAYRAIKIVRRDQFDCDKSFEREFHGIQAFEPVSRTHANLLQILHAGRNQTDGFYFYVMELADDITEKPISDPDTYTPRTLRSILREPNRLTVTKAVQIGRELASGLAHLHGLGLVHRDIKPSNIVFVNGVPKLGDAGLVSQSREDMSYVGTEGYVPPEGMGKPQADIYSLGMLLYEIGTGKARPDFPEMPSDLPSREDKPLFLQLNKVVLKACETNPARRFKSASLLMAALNRIQPEKMGTDEIHARFPKKYLAWTAALLLIVLLVLVLASVKRLNRGTAKNHGTQKSTLAPSVDPGFSPIADQEIESLPGPELNVKATPSPDIESSDAVIIGNNRQIQKPMPVKTITTESAGEFLHP